VGDTGCVLTGWSRGPVQADHSALIRWIARARRRAQHAPVTLKWDPDFELPSRTFWHSRVGDTVPDLVRGSCMRQLLIVEPRLVKVAYPAITYTYKSHMSDTEPSSQWMAENPNVRVRGILTGRAPNEPHSLPHAVRARLPQRQTQGEQKSVRAPPRHRPPHAPPLTGSAHTTVAPTHSSIHK